MTVGAGVRGTGRRRKINLDRLREMVGMGATTAEVMHAFGVTRKSIVQACETYDIPLPVMRGYTKPDRAPQPDAKHDHSPRHAQLIATGGRYADLAAWAKTWGVTQTRALQEWHALRLPLQKGRAA
jgi:hypothetical protein